MIAYLEGQLLSRLSDAVVVMTAGGVGYQVRLPVPLLAQAADQLAATPGSHGGAGVGPAVRYHISTVVRETELTLYGFAGPDGKALFELLNTVSGIGPKLALALLSAFSPAEAMDAIVGQDAARLSSVPGVGKKTAHRLCLELGERLASWQLPGGAEPSGAPGRSRGHAELSSALTNLGFSEKDVLAALRQLVPGAAPFPEQLRKALALLGRS